MANWSVQSLEDGLYAIRQYLGSDWIARIQEQQLRIDARKKGLGPFSFFLSRTAHPLATSFRLAERDLESMKSGQNKTPSQSLAICARLGMNMRKLAQANAVGFSGKLDQIKREPGSFDDLAYELWVAANHNTKATRCDFKKTEAGIQKKTADLLVHCGAQVEIECKVLAKQSDRDIKNQNLMEIIGRKTSEALHEADHCYATTVRFKEDLTEKSAGRIAATIAKLIRSGASGTFQNKELGVAVSISPNLRRDELLRGGVSVEMTKDMDYVITSLEAKVERGGRVEARNLNILGFTQDVHPDRLVGLFNAIKAGRKQLSGDLPGVICIHQTSFGREDFQTMIQRRKDLIMDVIRQSERISAVVVTNELWGGDKNKEDDTKVGSVLSGFYRNPRARFPVPGSLDLGLKW